MPAGTVLDDVYWPLRVAMAGRRVVMEPRAHAFDRLPANASDEFRRKVRTLAGNFQLTTSLPAALLPWRNPIWLQFLSHKLLRLLVPWAVLALLPLSALADGAFYRMAFWWQVEGYVIGLTSLAFRNATRRSRLLSAAGSFLVLNGGELGRVLGVDFGPGGAYVVQGRVRHAAFQQPARGDDLPRGGSGGLRDEVGSRCTPKKGRNASCPSRANRPQP